VLDSSPLKNLKGRKAYTGMMTPGSRKRLKRAIQILCAIAEPKTAMNFKLNKEFKFKLNFITLTLPSPQGQITDQEIHKRCLDPWIKKAKRRFHLRSYIWRAERQGNGNLHFHIVTDTYIPYDELRDTWNDNLNALGFIDRFEHKHGHRHPNSTDVHAIKQVKNLAAYFSKYMAKGERCAEDLQGRAPLRHKLTKPLAVHQELKLKRVLSLAESRINGRTWDCSTNLKVKGNCEMLIEGDAAAVFQLAEADPEVRQFSTETCLILFLSPQQFRKYIKGELHDRYQAWLDNFRRLDYNIIPFPNQSPKELHVTMQVAVLTDS
jgi:hypothetical protein